MSLSARFPGVEPYAKEEEKGSGPSLREPPRLDAYDEYLLANARERVEEEIAAMSFVRGAWREMRRKGA